MTRDVYKETAGAAAECVALNALLQAYPGFVGESDMQRRTDWATGVITELQLLVLIAKGAPVVLSFDDSGEPRFSRSERDQFDMRGSGQELIQLLREMLA